jgi:hypothetical protein
MPISMELNVAYTLKNISKYSFHHIALTLLVVDTYFKSWYLLSEKGIISAFLRDMEELVIAMFL